MKELKIDWLDECLKCGSSIHTVKTENGSQKWLYDGDTVKCDCGQAGEIETDGECAWVNWDEEPPMINLELAKDIRESLAAHKIGGARYIMSSEEVELAYEVFNDYIMRNDEASVDVKLPFDVIQSLKEVS